MPPRIYTVIIGVDSGGLSSAGRSHALFLGLATLGVASLGGDLNILKMF